MALQTTRDAVRSILKTDPTCNADDRQRVLAALNGKGPVADGAAVKAAPPRIVRFPEAAAQLGIGVRLLHRMAQFGQIRKCKLPGRVRYHGILEEDLARLMREGVQVAVAGASGQTSGASDQ